MYKKADGAHEPRSPLLRTLYGKMKPSDEEYLRDSEKREMAFGMAYQTPGSGGKK